MKEVVHKVASTNQHTHRETGLILLPRALTLEVKKLGNCHPIPYLKTHI